MDLDGEPNALGRKLITNCAKVRTAPLACILLSLTRDFFYMHLIRHIMLCLVREKV